MIKIIGSSDTYRVTLNGLYAIDEWPASRLILRYRWDRKLVLRFADDKERQVAITILDQHLVASQHTYNIIENTIV
jgi:hypothetical protein